MPNSHATIDTMYAMMTFDKIAHSRNIPNIHKARSVSKCDEIAPSKHFTIQNDNLAREIIKYKYIEQHVRKTNYHVWSGYMCSPRLAIFFHVTGSKYQIIQQKAIQSICQLFERTHGVIKGKFSNSRRGESGKG